MHAVLLLLMNLWNSMVAGNAEVRLILCLSTKICNERKLVLAMPKQNCGTEPEWSLTVPYVLTFPLQNIEDVQNAIVSPIWIQYAIQGGLRGKIGWEWRHERFSQNSRSQRCIWNYCTSAY